MEKLLGGDNTPVVAATDYVKMLPSKSGNLFRRDMSALGTDGFGRSDTRQTCAVILKLTVHHIAYAAIAALVGDKNWTPKPQKRAQKI